MNTPKPARPRAVYQVTFNIEIDVAPEDVEHASDSNVLVEEAFTSLMDEELHAHRDGGTLCGLNFKDAHSFKAMFIAVKS